MGRETRILLGLLGLLAGLFVGVLSLKLLVPRPPAGAGPDVHGEVAFTMRQELVPPPLRGPRAADYAAAPPLTMTALVTVDGEDTVALPGRSGDAGAYPTADRYPERPSAVADDAVLAADSSASLPPLPTTRDPFVQPAAWPESDSESVAAATHRSRFSRASPDPETVERGTVEREAVDPGRVAPASLLEDAMVTADEPARPAEAARFGFAGDDEDQAPDGPTERATASAVGLVITSPGDPSATPARADPGVAIRPAFPPAPGARAFAMPSTTSPAHAEAIAGSHVVAAGESWWSVAERAYGDGRLYRALYAWNRAIDPRVALAPGTHLEVPPVERLAAAWPALVPTGR